MEKKSTTFNTRSKNRPLLKTLIDFILKNKKSSDHHNESAHLTRGKQGENLAAKYLKKHKYKIVERNYRCKLGEIDIVALDGNVLSFIEVKTRSSSEVIPPEFTVTKHKQSKIKKSAAHYLGKHGIEKRDCRFDIVAITMEGKKNSVTLYKNAFS